jgi:hypothetical protein
MYQLQHTTSHRIKQYAFFTPTNNHNMQQSNYYTTILYAEQQSRKKKNKYSQFSKQTTLDPMEEMLLESRSKLRQMKDTKEKTVQESLEAVEGLLSSIAPDDVVEKKRMWERNQRQFPDNKSIDPYDPTTYGYIELGTSSIFPMWSVIPRNRLY